MTSSISCPVDHVKISTNRVRLTALLVLLTSVSFLITGQWWIALFLSLDFFMRAFGWGTYSPLPLISGWLERLFRLPTKLTDRAPKIFAAQIGFFLSDCLVVATVFELNVVAYGIAGVLVLFSFLESAVGFCAGCYAYTLLKRFI